MPAVKHGGLSGKARRARARNRAARQYANQLITEYLEPNPVELRRERHIPIRSRNEFLPSVAHTVLPEMNQRTAGTGDTQLELPATSEDKAIRFAHTAKPATDRMLARPDHSGRKLTLTLRGFILGCAMGSAAAALVLLILYAAIG